MPKPLPPVPDPAPVVRTWHRHGRTPADVLGVIAVGAMVGAPARYGVAQLLPRTGTAFPWATFWTNVSGSFLLGAVLVVVIERFPPSRYLRPYFAVGVLGSYTTFSTFVVEADLLVRDGHAGLAIAYAAASLAAGFAAVWGGIVLTRAAPRRARGQVER